MSGSGHTLQDACAALCAERISHLMSASGGSLLALMRTEHAKLSAEITVVEETRCLTASAIYPALIPKTCRTALIEYILRANAFEPTGGFIYDYDTGELTFAVDALFDDDGFSDALLWHAMSIALERLDQHLDPLGRIIYDQARPTDALERVFRFDLDEELRRASDDL